MRLGRGEIVMPFRRYLLLPLLATRIDRVGIVTAFRRYLLLPLTGRPARDRIRFRPAARLSSPAHTRNR